MKRKSKSWAVRGLLSAGLFLTGGMAAAESFTSETARPSSPVLSVLKTACSAGSALGLCSDGKVSPRSLSLSAFRVVAAKAAPNRLLEIAKLFIDNLEVAQIGNTKIKISIELR